jgi:hypothetical protein
LPAGHRELMGCAIERDGAAQRALLAGQAPAARDAFAEAAEFYRRSWERAAATSYGRLIGMLKSAVLSGGGEDQASYARAQLSADGGSPAAAYVQALAALICDDDDGAIAWSQRMRSGGDAFVRTADAIEALAVRDRAAYAAALEPIVRDFEQRSEHLTGVAIADTALMLQQLAARRGVAAGLESRVLPKL